MSVRTFPEGFLFGAATAAYQIEGATHADGRTDSIWDAFSRVPGAIVGGDTGDVADDHYRRMPDDVALMSELGLHAYRFSVAWPRVRPDGGAVNRAGLDFYSRLVDQLLDRGITPWVTLYHWDLPQVLEERGGWTSRDTAFRFAEYAESVFDVLGDRVEQWTTLNEPWCSALLGYASGEHAPGRQEPKAAVAAIHHLLLAHGLGTQAIRARSPHPKLGITLNMSPVTPADPDDPADLEAVRRIDGLFTRVFLEPVLLGAYPDDVVADLADLGFDEHINPGDLEIIGAPIDMLGVNYYSRAHVSGHGGGASDKPLPGVARELASAWVGSEYVGFVSQGRPRTAMGWEVDASGLRDLLVRLRDDYPTLPPIYITENGAAYDDKVSPDGSVQDPERLDYVRQHLVAVHDAIEAGVDVQGYMVWSLLDNFEWAWGYAKRFGIVRVDYDTLVRTPKASAQFFAQVARSGVVDEAG